MDKSGGIKNIAIYLDRKEMRNKHHLYFIYQYLIFVDIYHGFTRQSSWSLFFR